ncbi:MAG: RES family NAD+ phosphorylase [Verrucomicrobiota bacterium]
MTVWRICRAKYLSSAFSGLGAEKVGGRWNFKGYPVVYTSENLSLAILELFVHADPGLIPGDLVSVRGRLPESVSMESVDQADLPDGWRDYPGPVELSEIGTDWIKGRSSLGLGVPSAINPVENNILLNPEHDEMKTLLVEGERSFEFDPLLFDKQKK